MIELKNLFSESWSDIWIFNVKSNNKSTPFLVMTPENLTLIDSPQKNLLRWKDYFKTTKYHLKTTSKLLQRNLELLSRQVDLNDYDQWVSQIIYFHNEHKRWTQRRSFCDIQLNPTVSVHPSVSASPSLCLFPPYTFSRVSSHILFPSKA